LKDYVATMKVKFYLWITLIPLLCLWLAGFLWFAHYTLTLENKDDINADVTVVLTGDTGRLMAAARLLRKNHTDMLFISGVGGGAELDALSGSDILSEYDKQKISLGRKAINTRENALETKTFLQDKNVKSMLLVTSYYHIPRSTLEFKRALPEVYIKPYPVFNTKPPYKSLKLLIKEYNKFILSFIRAKFFKCIGME
jgi:uncharacterized SAM-binding protein YcdF (DUF218 family)